MKFWRRRSAGLAAAVAAMMIVPLAAPAGAATVSEPLADGLAGPLGLAVGSDGTVYVSQTFAGILTAIDKDGNATNVAMSDDPNASIAGVDAKGKGTLSYTLAGAEEGDEGVDFIGFVKRVLPNGKVKTLGDTATWEEEKNPDQINSYGFQGLTAECAEQVPDEIGGFPYSGLVDSNTYAVAIVGGSRIVADAGGNSIVRVGANGRVSTVAVLPPVPGVIPPEAAAAFGLPDCVVGETFNFEPVPTDVELGRDGLLYVSSLPGGPEGLFPLGGVFTVDPRTGEVNRIAQGFFGAVDLAVADDGTVYVAELFGNRISKVVGGAPEPVVELNEPGAVEFAKGTLYATSNVFGNGAVVTISP